jgi:hypothetical protein
MVNDKDVTCRQNQGHSIAKIVQGLKINGEIEEAGKFLDLFYISARLRIWKFCKRYF